MTSRISVETQCLPTREKQIQNTNAICSLFHPFSYSVYDVGWFHIVSPSSRNSSDQELPPQDALLQGTHLLWIQKVALVSIEHHVHQQ